MSNGGNIHGQSGIAVLNQRLIIKSAAYYFREGVVVSWHGVAKPTPAYLLSSPPVSASCLPSFPLV